MNKRPVIVAAVAVLVLGIAVAVADGVWYSLRKHRYEEALVTQHRRSAEMLGELGRALLRIDLESCEANRWLIQHVDADVEENKKLAAAVEAARQPLNDVEQAEINVRSYNRVMDLKVDYGNLGKTSTDRLIKLHDTCPELVETLSEHLKSYIESQPHF
jgi:hypothetical protein